MDKSFLGNGRYVGIYDSSIQTLDAWKTHLQSYPIEILYQKATPTRTLLASNLTEEDVIAKLQVNGSVVIGTSDIVEPCAEFDVLYKKLTGSSTQTQSDDSTEGDN